MTLPVTRTAAANPETIAQFVIGSNARVLLLGIQISPLGSTAASAPIHWNFGTQDGAGTSTANTSDLVKDSPDWTGTTTNYLTTLGTFTAEATHTDKGYDITLHQQSTLFWKEPQKGYVIMDPSERWGLQIQSAAAFDIVYNFYLEL